MGPFAVVDLVGPVAVHLALTRKLRGLHPVFHISLLRRYKPGGDGVGPLPPIVADEKKNIMSRPYFHTVFGKGPDSTLYAGGATIAAKTAA